MTATTYIVLANVLAWGLLLGYTAFLVNRSRNLARRTMQIKLLEGDNE